MWTVVYGDAEWLQGGVILPQHSQAGGRGGILCLGSVQALDIHANIAGGVHCCAQAGNWQQCKQTRG